MELRPDVRTKLLAVAAEFEQFTELDLKPVDVVIVGSSASYNWSEEWSDIDLHLIYDIDQSTADGAKTYILLDTKKNLWNEKYKIVIKRLPVEVYVQLQSEHNVENGMYSITNDEWVHKPEQSEITLPDDGAVEVKANSLRNMINAVLKESPVNSDRLDQVKAKIKRTRQAGLDKAGLFSVENLAFKILRRDGSIGKLMQATTAAKTKNLSLESRY